MWLHECQLIMNVDCSFLTKNLLNHFCVRPAEYRSLDGWRCFADVLARLVVENSGSKPKRHIVLQEELAHCSAALTCHRSPINKSVEWEKRGGGSSSERLFVSEVALQTEEKILYTERPRALFFPSALRKGE